MMGAPTRHRGRSRYPTRSRNAGAVGAAPVTFTNPLTDWTTDPLHGVWASDPLWTPPADGGAVSSWRNGGTVGGDLVQVTGSKQPTYDAQNPSYNNAAVVTFATDDVLSVNVDDVAQPYYLVIVGNTAGGTGVERLVGIAAGEPASSGSGFGDNGGGTWSLRGGSGAPTLTGGTADANPHLFVGTYNGASSGMSVDGAATASGTTGTGSLQVFAVGAAVDASNSGFSYYLNGSVALALVFTTNPTSQAEWATFKAWVTSTYGITVA